MKDFTKTENRVKNIDTEELEDLLHTLKGRDGCHHFFPVDALVNGEHQYNDLITSAVEAVLGDDPELYDTYECFWDVHNEEYEGGYEQFVEDCLSQGDDVINSAVQKVEEELERRANGE